MMPCRNCIVLAICKARLKEFWVIAGLRCKILNEYIYKDENPSYLPPMTPTTEKRFREVSNFMKGRTEGK
jgi:hypothetical protein